jgi:hypothetical protein
MLVLRSVLVVAGLASLVACSSGEPAASSSGGSSSSSSGGSSSSSSSGGASVDAGGDGAAGPVTTYTRKALNFDELASGAAIADQYAQWATFSTDPGCAISATSSAGVAASQPNYLWTYYSCANGPSAPFFIDFAKPVKNPSFTLVGVNASQKVATLRLVKKDGSKVTKDVVGKGSYSVPVPVDTTETDVVRIEIVDVNDAYGLGLDDVTFDFPNP